MKNFKSIIKEVFLYSEENFARQVRFSSAMYLEKQWWLWKKSLQGKTVKSDVATAVWFQIMS
jgi:hypothetical protein